MDLPTQTKRALWVPTSQKPTRWDLPVRGC